jgi:ABC-type branched-subunit amino acid transport system ATPase component
MSERAAEVRALNLSVGYERVPVLEGVGLCARGGEVVGVIGGNGSGKSTLLQTLVGLLPPIAGDVLIGGESVVRVPASARVRRMRLGYVPQYGRRIPGLTVAENLHLAQWGRGSRAERRGRIERLLTEEPFDQLRGHLGEHAGALSGGQSLLLALATLRLQDSEVILLDEPSDGLVERNRWMAVELIRRMKEAGKAVVMVEQLLRVVFSVCDRVYVAGPSKAGSAAHGNPSRPNVGRLRELEAAKLQAIRALYSERPLLPPAHTDLIDSLLWGD